MINIRQVAYINKQGVIDNFNKSWQYDKIKTSGYILTFINCKKK